MNTWKSKNRHKYLLQYHLILVCKYRNKLLNEPIRADIIRLSDNVCKKQHTIIKKINTDQDHIHYLPETEPTVAVSKIISTLKSYTTYHIWKLYPEELSLHFWKEHTFWTDISFAALETSANKLFENTSKNRVRICLNKTKHISFDYIPVLNRSNSL